MTAPLRPPDPRGRGTAAAIEGAFAALWFCWPAAASSALAAGLRGRRRPPERSRRGVLGARVGGRGGGRALRPAGPDVRQPVAAAAGAALIGIAGVTVAGAPAAAIAPGLVIAPAAGTWLLGAADSPSPAQVVPAPHSSVRFAPNPVAHSSAGIADGA